MTSAANTATTQTRITPDDIEAKFRELGGEVDTTKDAARNYLVVAGAVVALVVIAGVFLAGRRRGRKRQTIVEVRRL